MAVSVDTVYQRVLAIANKEQRGYITPQEFNLFADQAQKEIFEQYFYDLNQFRPVLKQNLRNWENIRVPNLENKLGPWSQSCSRREQSTDRSQEAIIV